MPAVLEQARAAGAPDWVRTSARQEADAALVNQRNEAAAYTKARRERPGDFRTPRAVPTVTLQQLNAQANTLLKDLRQNAGEYAMDPVTKKSRWTGEYNAARLKAMAPEVAAKKMTARQWAMAEARRNLDFGNQYADADSDGVDDALEGGAGMEDPPIPEAGMEGAEDDNPWGFGPGADFAPSMGGQPRTDFQGPQATMPSEMFAETPGRAVSGYQAPAPVAPPAPAPAATFEPPKVPVVGHRRRTAAGDTVQVSDYERRIPGMGDGGGVDPQKVALFDEAVAAITARGFDSVEAEQMILSKLSPEERAELGR